MIRVNRVTSPHVEARSCGHGYIYGPNNLPIEQITSGGTVTYLHRDQQGFTRLIKSTTPLAQCSTSTTTSKAPPGSSPAPQGKSKGSAATAPTGRLPAKAPLGWDAQYTSTDSGLIYLRARVYDPGTGQFLTVDPWVGLRGEPYSYSEDDPINKYDPTGRCSFICVAGVAAVATGIGSVVVGTGALATTLAATSVVTGAGAFLADGDQCVTHGGVACVALPWGPSRPGLQAPSLSAWAELLAPG